MKKYPKIVQVGSRGAIVIPKEMRRELNIDEGAAFWVYAIGDDGLFLQRAEEKSLEDNAGLKQLEDKKTKIGLHKDAVSSAKKHYKRPKKHHNLEMIE